MKRRLSMIVAMAILSSGVGVANAAGDVVKSITIRAPRDMGFFAGDIVRADIDIVVQNGYRIEDSSLPHPGAIAYWLDLRKVDVVSRSTGADHRYELKLVYQNFYDALDARPQEIPTFSIVLTDGTNKTTADIPAWTIGVSALREVAPPVKDDPKDYMRPDVPATFISTLTLRTGTLVTGLATLLAFALLARDRLWWPFRARPSRVFGDALRRLRTLTKRNDGDEAYIDALLVLHRGVDSTAGQRVLADDLPIFLSRHPLYSPARANLAAFFAASRLAFFGSDPAGARRAFGFDALQSTARELATIERKRP